MEKVIIQLGRRLIVERQNFLDAASIILSANREGALVPFQYLHSLTHDRDAALEMLAAGNATEIIASGWILSLSLKFSMGNQ